jgi:5-hydroxyisourate hydrolase
MTDMGASTHVLDLATGLPAAGVPVRLERDGKRVAEATTDADGRVAVLAEVLEAGVYELVFDTAAFGNPFYPQVTVAFRVVDAAVHHHIPLLLSPYGYATYRGS